MEKMSIERRIREGLYEFKVNQYISLKLEGLGNLLCKYLNIFSSTFIMVKLI